MTALIFQPAKNAMQSGKAKTRQWVLVFEAATPRELDPLMGWTGVDDMNTEIDLHFASKDEAERYAIRHGLDYTIIDKPPAKRLSKSYADNFKADRRSSWTH